MSEIEDLGTQDLSPYGAEVISAQVTRASGPGVEERWADVDGGRIRYLQAGSGPPLVLVHGLLGYSFSWRYVMLALAPHFTVFAPDMLGAGFSDRAPNIDYSMRATARRLVEFFTKIELPSSSIDLVGTSHGGAVAMMATEECMEPESPVRVQRLVLVAPANPYSAHGRWLAPFFATPFGASLFRGTIARMRFLYHFWLQRLYGGRGKPIPPGTLEGYMAPLAVPGLFEHGLSIVRTWNRDLKELQGILPRIGKIPTLFIWGKNDPAVYASSAQPLARHFPNSELTIFPGIAHLPYEECPEQFNRVLLEFLARKMPKQ